MSLLGGAAPAADAPEGLPLAWIRFVGDEPVEEYEGTPYLWLGRVEMTLTIDVQPGQGHALDLLWGSKNDSRGAVATINGKALKISHGGYNGFRWLRVPIPKGVTGPKYQIVLKAGAEKPGFISAVRLTQTGDTGAPMSDTEPAAHKIALATKTSGWSAPPKGGEAFPEMRPLWDTPVELPSLEDPLQQAAFVAAEQNARQAAEMFFRCRRFVDGWLAQADETTGLIPRNLSRNRDVWNAKDSAADNYPFMVLTAALTDRALFDGRMREMLATETRLTSRVGRLPDTWSFTKQAFDAEDVNLDSILFGASEYCKDGLMPLTEWLGPSPWSERMVGMVDDIFAHANVDTPHGKIPTSNIEVHGELLQVLSRLYWMTGERKYLEWALRLGDYYLLGDRHPTDDLDRLRLSDHGCEITDGLAELYVTVHFVRPEKKRLYQEPIHRMFDRILEIGRDPLGMMYVSIEPKTGKRQDRITDTWGYNYYGVYSVYLVDETEAYRQAVLDVMGSLDKMADHNWGGADAFADSIEGAVNLHAREPSPQAAEYMDRQIPLMWSRQKSDGIIEGWHGDGNSARTAIMYALWKTQGTYIEPWREDVRFGASRKDGKLYLVVTAEKPWKGRVRFDVPRHREYLKLPIDYTRINQFPEWFTVDKDESYTVRRVAAPDPETRSGTELSEGLAVELTRKNRTALIMIDEAE
jgi:hypothetical protein